MLFSCGQKPLPPLVACESNTSSKSVKFGPLELFGCEVWRGETAPPPEGLA